MMKKHAIIIAIFLGLYIPPSNCFAPVKLGTNEIDIKPSSSWSPRRTSSFSTHYRAKLRPLGRDLQSRINSQVVQSSSNLDLIRVEEVERNLLKSITLYKSSNASQEKPSSAAFISLIEKWLAFPYPERAEMILDKMEELYTPSGRIYERIINAWSFRAVETINQSNSLWDKPLVGLNDDREQDLTEDESKKESNRIREVATNYSSRAAELLNRMEQLQSEVGDDFRPALSTYTSVINAITRSSQKDSSSFAAQKEVIDRIRAKRDEIYKYLDLKRISISCVEDVFSILKNCENHEQVISKLKIDPELSPIPNRFNFNIIINALAQTGEIWAAQAAESILDFMVQQSQQGQRQFVPNIETFNGCINAWAHSSMEEGYAASRAEAILDKLILLQSTDDNLKNVVPDNVTYNTIIKAYANASDAKRAESILANMMALYQKTGNEKVRPDLISYSSVLKAYAKLSAVDSNASKKSEEVLMQMIRMQQEKENSENTRIVNTWCFNTVLNAYAVQGAGGRASSLLSLMETMGENDDMLKPDIYSYNTVLKALANNKEKGSVERARQILEKMERRHANGESSIKPDAITYNTVILAHANNGGLGAGNAAKNIVERMEARFLNGDINAKPTSSTYTSLIKAFHWEKDSTQYAEQVLRHLLLKSNPVTQKGLVRPDAAIYNAVLNSWAKNGSRLAVQRAEEILNEMLKEYQETGDNRVRPNCRTYSTIIDILAKSGEQDSAERALEILDEMEKQYERGDLHADAKPNVFTYTAVINCFARSKEKDKAVQAVNVLQRMEEQYRKGNDAARPNTVAYNSVLNACAYTTNKDAEAAETAFKIACLVFDEVRTSCHVQPTHVTYGTFLRVCANLMPTSDVKDKLVEATFKRCAKEGLVSNMVWRNLKAAASPLLLSELLEQANNGLEASWTRNV